MSLEGYMDGTLPNYSKALGNVDGRILAIKLADSADTSPQ